MTRRRAARLLAAAVCALALAAPAGAAPPAPEPDQLTLRLPDVGPSYELGGSRCAERSRSEDREWPRTLPDLAARFPHRGCVIAFGESWRVPGTPRLSDYVMSAAFSFADAAGPTAALQRPRAVAAHILDAKRRDLAPLTVDAAIGDELLAFHSDGFPFGGTAVLWRSGPVLALTLAAGPANDRTTRAALRLATAQQARIATPTPLLPADLDDVEVPLNHPRIGVPVAWLGRELPAVGRFPALRLVAVDGPVLEHPRTEPRAAMSYAARGGTDHVGLSLWRPGLVRRLLRSPQLDPFCPRTFDAGVEGINATLVGYRDPAPILRDPARIPGDCARRRPDVWTAVAVLPRVAVTIEAGACGGCRRRGAYDSPAGMRAIIRALRLRAP